MADADDAGATRKKFLKHCQLGELGEAQQLVAQHPEVATARSTSKGYSAMHFAAMGGATAVCEWLETVGIEIEVESPDGTTPLQVALEYKRLLTARRLQKMRDLRRQGIDHIEEARLTAEAKAKEEAEVRAKAEAEAAAERAAAAKREAEAKAIAEAKARADAAKAESDAANLRNANREAAAQALAAGRNALRSADMMKAVRLLRKANNLSPDDGEIQEALAEAEREYNAVVREQQAEQQAMQREAAEAQKEWNLPPSKPAATAVPPSMRSPPQPRPQPSSSRSGGRADNLSAAADDLAAGLAGAGGSSNGGGGGGSSSSYGGGSGHGSGDYGSASSAGAASTDSASGGRLAAFAGFLLAILLAVGGLVVKVGEKTGLLWLATWLAALPVQGWRHLSGWASRKWDSLFDVEPDSRERLAYLFYYWRARLRWPIRLLGILFLLLLAWRYPWHAYSVVVLGIGGGATFFAPYIPKVDQLAQPRAVIGSAAATVTFVCWLLPVTTAWLVGIALWGLIAYISWQLCAGGTALLLLFYFFPTLALGLVAVAAWLLFLVILPKICLFVCPR